MPMSSMASDGWAANLVVVESVMISGFMVGEKGRAEALPWIGLLRCLRLHA